VDRSGFVTAADAYLADCFARETPPHVNELATRCQLPTAAFSRGFLFAVGEQPGAYLKRGQVQHAAELLRTTNLTMNAVGYAAGFGTRMSFFRAFRRATGKTPQQYRDTFSR